MADLKNKKTFILDKGVWTMTYWKEQKKPIILDKGVWTITPWKNKDLYTGQGSLNDNSLKE